MDPFFVIFVLFSPLWWLLFFVASGLIVFAIENESGVWATVVLVASVLLMTLFGTMPNLDWFRDHSWTFLTCITAYFAIGAVWGCVIKWYFFCVARREKYDTLKRHWLREQGKPDTKVIPDDLKDKWAELLLRNEDFSYGWSSNRTIQIEPKYWDHKAKVLRWMTYWPWSMIWSIFDDLVRNIFKHLQRFFSGVMEWISNFVFRDLDADFKVKEKEEEVK